jgi:hypothetical protein
VHSHKYLFHRDTGPGYSLSHIFQLNLLLVAAAATFMAATATVAVLMALVTHVMAVAAGALHVTAAFSCAVGYMFSMAAVITLELSVCHISSLLFLSRL